MMGSLAVHCQWKEETVSQRNGHPLSYADAKKMKSLTLHAMAALGLA